MTLPEGWLSDAEAAELERLADGRIVLEFGSYKGRSTVALARTAKQVVSIDLHRPFVIQSGGAEFAYDDTLDEYFANVRDLANVVSIVGPFDVARLFRRDAFGLLFVDGVHDEVNASADLTLAFEFEADVAAHDWFRYDLPKVAGDLDVHPDYVVDSLAVWA